MKRLKATKTSLHKLVGRFTTLPSMRKTYFTKAPYSRSYWLEWGTHDGFAKAFFSVCMGYPLLSIEIRDVDGIQISRKVHTLSVQELQDYGMVEEFTPVPKRRPVCEKAQ